MKQINMLVFCLLFAITVSAQESGIQFEQSSWTSILAKAKESNKIIMVDAYATWCGPCKKMSADVFTENSVGSFYNDKFINAKIDMEKGEGLKLAEMYNVKAYPTFLFIAPDGELVHRVAGYHASDDFIALGENALNPEKQLVTLQKRFENGERDENFLFNYAFARRDAADGSHGPIASEYLKTQKDWSSKDNMNLIFQLVNAPGTEGFSYLLDNRDAFTETFGEEMVDAKIDRTMMAAGFQVAHDSNGDLAVVDEYYKNLTNDNCDRYCQKFRMNYYGRAGDVRKYAETAVYYYNLYPSSNWSELNAVAWNFYEAIDDKTYLEKAVEWAERSVFIDSNFYNNDTLAALNYKLGNKKSAKKAAKKAIKFAKMQGEDFSETAELLTKIKAL